jgi:aconitase A
VTLLRADGPTEHFDALAEVETAQEVAVLRAGGILRLILRERAPVTADA